MIAAVVISLAVILLLRRKSRDRNKGGHSTCDSGNAALVSTKLGNGLGCSPLPVETLLTELEGSNGVRELEAPKKVSGLQGSNV